MDYCKIGSHTFKAQKIEVTSEKIWSENTKRTVTGLFVGDIVAIKLKYSVTFPPMDGADVALLDSLISAATVNVQFKNPRTNALETHSFYTGTPSYPVYAYVNGIKEYVGTKVDFIER